MTTIEPMFRALSDGTRQRLLRVLAANELSVSELVEVLDQPQSTISRHLKVLREADLLLDRRNGTTTLYSARPARTNDSNGAGQIQQQLWEWVRNQELESAIDRRLQRALRRRRGDSGDFFEVVGARWDQLRLEAFGDSFHFEAFTALLPSEWTVADIGTGTGYLLPVLTACFRTVIAVEPAGAMLDAARSRPELKSAANVQFRPGSLDQLPISNGEVDLAIASLVLHHVAEPLAALREMKRCVHPGGKLLIIEQKTHQYGDFHNRMGDHWWGFDPAALAQWVSDAGFSEVRVRPLSAVRSGRNAGDVPGLFVLTAASGVAKPNAANAINTFLES